MTPIVRCPNLHAKQVCSTLSLKLRDVENAVLVERMIRDMPAHACAHGHHSAPVKIKHTDTMLSGTECPSKPLDWTCRFIMSAMLGTVNSCLNQHSQGGDQGQEFKAGCTKSNAHVLCSPSVLYIVPVFDHAPYILCGLKPLMQTIVSQFILLSSF